MRFKFGLPFAASETEAGEGEGGEAGGGQGVGGRGDQRLTFIVGAFTPRSTRRMNSTGHC